MSGSLETNLTTTYEKQIQAKQIRSYKYEMDEDSVSSFGGLSLNEYLANRLGSWKGLVDQMPDRQGKYERIDIIRGVVNDLLSGSRGTASLREIAEDEAILKLLGIKQLPGEKIVWEELERLGTDEALEGLNEVLSGWAYKLEGLLDKVIELLGWRSKSLFLMNSLHGDGPTLDKLEAKKLYYVIGANKLKVVHKVLDELPQ